MMLEIAHTKLEVYGNARQMVVECYKVSACLPRQEQFSLVQQINRAAISVVLNIAEGSSRRSSLERKRFFEIARGSVIEIDAGFQVCLDLGYIQSEQLQTLKTLVNSVFKMLSKMINQLS